MKKKKSFFKNIFTQQVAWKRIAGHECIYVILSEYITKEEIEDVVNRSVELIEKSDQDKAILVWNASAMKKYTTAAREHCQYTLKEYDDIIDSVWVISKSTIVYGIAEIISFFASRTIKVVKSLEILEKRLQDYQKK